MSDKKQRKRKKRVRLKSKKSTYSNPSPHIQKRISFPHRSKHTSRLPKQKKTPLNFETNTITHPTHSHQPPRSPSKQTKTNPQRNTPAHIHQKLKTPLSSPLLFSAHKNLKPPKKPQQNKNPTKEEKKPSNQALANFHEYPSPQSKSHS